MAIAYDNFSSGGTGYPNPTLSHTIAAANDRILIAFYYCGAASSASAIMTSATYDGTAATGSFNITDLKYSNYYGITMYYWLEADLPASAGAYDLVGTTTSGFWGVADSCTSFTGVNQIAPVNASDSDATGNTGASSVGITTPAANSVIADACLRWAGSNVTLTPSSGQTKRGQVTFNSQSDFGISDEAVATAQLYTQGWTFTNEDMWLAAAYAFGPAGGVATPQYNMLAHNF